VVRPDGCRLYVETHGDRSSPPVVLLEGMGGDVAGWRRNIPRLARETFVVAFDHRGNGRSDAPDEPVTMATFVDDTLAVMDEAGVERGYLYGMSFGGGVAQELALSHPERVLGLILAATTPGGPDAARERTPVPKDRPYLALYSESFAAENPDHVREDLVMGSRRRQRPHARRRQWEAFQGFDASGRLGSLDVPTLVLHGTDDRISPVANARLLASLIPGAELSLLEGAGHVYHSEQPEASDGAVLDFIRRHRDG
jgi:pimeloyl-ACP methyl ester carboxylesterase